ncbi:MAG: hypothetical protein IT290_09940 [Deltaproteobacteria bacterium]|nr:hypothetical protein [Deltaproteobacteria bacterium]
MMRIAKRTKIVENSSEGSSSAAPLRPQLPSSFIELLAEGRIWRGEEPSSSTEEKRSESGHLASVAFDIPEIDSTLPAGGLSLHAIHEFAFSAPEITRNRKRWVAPCFIPSLLVARKIQRSRSGIALWIGRRCFPSPHVLEDIRRFLPGWEWGKRCFFIDPADKEQRLWSTIESLRSRGVGAIVADGSYIPFAASRRLQLAAGESNALFLLIRPPWEIEQPSVAQTKWRISSAVGPPQRSNRAFVFSLELLRARGLGEGAKWMCEWKSGRYGSKSFVVVSSRTVDGSIAERAEEERRVRR